MPHTCFPPLASAGAKTSPLTFHFNKVKLFTITSTNTMSLRSSMQASRRVFQTAASTHRSIVSSVCRRSFSAGNEPAISDLSASYIALEEKYGAHNYHPLPVVLTKGEGMCRCCLIRFQFSFARVHIMWSTHHHTIPLTSSLVYFPIQRNPRLGCWRKQVLWFPLR